MEFRKQKSIYHQIADLLSDRILASEWKQGERMASVRDVAEQLSVNPNTVLRAFDLLQESGIIFNRRGVGYFVADDARAVIHNLQKEEFFRDELPLLVQRLKTLDISLDLLNEAIKKQFEK